MWGKSTWNGRVEPGGTLDVFVSIFGHSSVLMCLFAWLQRDIQNTFVWAAEQTGSGEECLWPDRETSSWTRLLPGASFLHSAACNLMRCMIIIYSTSNMPRWFQLLRIAKLHQSSPLAQRWTGAGRRAMLSLIPGYDVKVVSCELNPGWGRLISQTQKCRRDSRKQSQSESTVRGRRNRWLQQATGDVFEPLHHHLVTIVLLSNRMSQPSLHSSRNAS